MAVVTHCGGISRVEGLEIKMKYDINDLDDKLKKDLKAIAESESVSSEGTRADIIARLAIIPR